MSIPRIGVLIPCYNVQKTIVKLLKSFRPEDLAQIEEIVAIDNASSDLTLVLLREIQASGGELGRKLTIIHNAKNYGYGGSQKIGYGYFLRSGVTHFTILHGDDQGQGAQSVRNFLAEFRVDPQVDVIIASRFCAGADLSRYSRLRVCGNLFFNFATWALTGLHMSDAGTAIIFASTETLRALPYDRLNEAFHFHPQLNILFYSNKKTRIREIPLDWADSEAGSHVQVYRYGVTLLQMLLGYSFRRFGLRQAPADAILSEKEKITSPGAPEIEVLRGAELVFGLRESK